jgi:hypothetical protein
LTKAGFWGMLGWYTILSIEEKIMLDLFMFMNKAPSGDYVTVGTFITALVGMLAMFLTMITVLYNKMDSGFEKAETERKGGFEKAETERKALATQINSVIVSLAELKAVMSMTKAIELGTTQEEVLKQAKKDVEDKAKSEN